MNKPWIFQRLSDLVGSSNPYYGSSLFDHKAAIEMVAKVKETLSKSAALKAEKDSEEKEDVLVRAKVEKLKKVASEAESLLVEKWREIEAMSKSEAATRHSDETQKAVAKLGKTLMKALKKIRKSEGELDAEVWSR